MEGPEETDQANDAVAPPELPNEQNQIGVWSSGLFGCIHNPCNAIVTCFCPCWTFDRIANIIDNGGIPCWKSAMTYMGYRLLFGITCKLTSHYRARLRNMYRIRPSPALDSVTHIFSCCVSAMTCKGYCLLCIGCGFAFNKIPCKLTSQYRAKLRAMYGIRPSPALDFVTHLFCECCALCQEYRELQARGWDPSIGWERNQAKNQNRNMQPTTMKPPVSQTMKS